MNDTRRQSQVESVENLLAHKRESSVKAKFDGDPKKRSIVPLNLNDIGNWDNMDLMGSLRSDKDAMVKEGETASVHSGAKNQQPPSFYEAEMTKWKNKFSQVVAERQAYKKRYLSTERKTILATNDNFKGIDADEKLNLEATYRGPGLHPTKSEFKKVAE